MLVVVAGGAEGFEAADFGFDIVGFEVERWLARLAKSLSTETLHRVHACLNRSVKRAMARDLVRRNVVELAEIPMVGLGDSRSR